MSLFSIATIALAYASVANAALCIPSLGGLLGIGSGTDTLNGTFALKARSASGEELVIVNQATPLPGGFFLPLYLGAANTSLDSFTTPLFTLQGGTAYASGGTVLSTMSSPLLKAEPLYISADGSRAQQLLQAINATCDGEPKTLLRFRGAVPIPLATASINQISFGPGAGISSPILDDLLTAGTPVDLVVDPHTTATA